MKPSTRHLTVAALAIVALAILIVPLHAQDPLISTTARLRNSIIVAGQNLGIVAFVFGFLGMMIPGHGHQEKLTWLMIGGAGVWSVTAIVNTFII